ncbi:MAG: NAD(P)-dependent oxidoreductase [Betaproteobacteria bacterium]|jgi:3-hydroxyisobutyrate dehydrogenase-like beta-hydroxyacid dehydrogenase
MATPRSIALKKPLTKIPARKKLASANPKKVSSKEDPVIGVVGLGIMGSSIATNLLKSGFRVVGFDTSVDQQKAMRKEGIKILPTVEALASESQYIFTSLPSVGALKVVVAAIAKSGKKGIAVAELSTLPHEAKEEARAFLAKHQITFLDCPLSGTGAQAKTRDLAVYASGDQKTIDAMDHVFEGFARARYYVGEFGAGMKMKLVANLLVAIHNVSTAEALLLGTRLGLDAKQIVDVIGDGAGSSRMFQVRAPMMVKRNWDEATMKIEVWAKDMHLIGEALKANAIPAPLFSTTIPIYNAASATGHDKDDTAVVYEVLEQWAKPISSKKSKNSKTTKKSKK